MKQSLTNGTNLLLRELLSLPGVAKTSGEVFQDGEIFCIVLPEPDLKWVKTADQQKTMNAEQLEAYQAADKAWSETPLEVEMTEKQRDRIKAVLTKVPTIAELRQTKLLFFLYRDFGFTP